MKEKTLNLDISVHIAMTTYSPVKVNRRFGRIYNLNLHLLMQLNPSWEAANCAATQELRSSLWDPKVHYRVHKSPPLVPILSQIDSIHTISSYLRSILMLPTHLRLCLPSGLLSSGYPINILYAVLFSPFMLNALSISSSLIWSF
jgi:hypothetical protein